MFFHFREFVFVCPYCTYGGKGARKIMVKGGGVGVYCWGVV